MTRAFSIGLRVLALTIVMFVCFAVGSLVLGQPSGAEPAEQSGAVALPLLAVCLLNTIVLTHVILRSRWGGWKLIATVFFVFYGAMTFMSQIESAVFITTLPPGMLPRIFLMGVLIAAPFAVVAVLILGKRKENVASAEINTRVVMPPGAWAWKLAVLAAAYVVLYFTFGYFIAWQDPTLREYYGGVDEGGFLVHMGTVARDTPWMIPFQVLRGLLWIAIAVPIVRMMRGGWQETAVAVGLVFAVLMTAQLLLPNPYMPDAVRMTHLVETASSNFLFGLLVGWLLTRGQPLPA